MDEVLFEILKDRLESYRKDYLEFKGSLGEITEQELRQVKNSYIWELVGHIDELGF